jgi:uncharacterized protein YdeI (YjbR/CyaY-like superfamily)
MPEMPITQTLYVTNREQWRAWLEKNYDRAPEIWLIRYNQTSGKPTIPYADSVQEALCFGWIDSIQKPYGEACTVQRFTPRRPGSGWSELNKERARRLVAEGRMTPAGAVHLPDLSTEAFTIPEDIRAALQADPLVWQIFQAFPESYRRIRVGYVDGARSRPEEFAKRLNHLIAKTRQNKQFGSIE